MWRQYQRYQPESLNIVSDELFKWRCSVLHGPIAPFKDITSRRYYIDISIVMYTRN